MTEEAKRYWRLFGHLRRFMELCDDDCAIDFETAEPLEAAGWVLFRKVTRFDLAEPFAAERGIEKDGFLWELTPAGREIWDEMRKRNDRP